ISGIDVTVAYDPSKVGVAVRIRYPAPPEPPPSKRDFLGDTPKPPGCRQLGASAPNPDAATQAIPSPRGRRTLEGCPEGGCSQTPGPAMIQLPAPPKPYDCSQDCHFRTAM